MQMYPNLDLYKAYRARLALQDFSRDLPNVTTRTTLHYMNIAINLCDKWDYCIDIGGGSGHYAAAMASRFKEVLLLEPERWPEQEILTTRYKNLRVEHSYIEVYNDTKKADFILLADVYEHIPDIDAFVKKMAAMQGGGGVVYILTPNPLRCGPATESALHHTRKKDGHIKHYTHGEIVALMASAGYGLESAMYEEGPWRQTVKRFIFAISRRDKSWSQKIPYKIMRPLVLLFAKALFFFFDKTVRFSEKRNQNNTLETLAQVLIFKKK